MVQCQVDVNCFTKALQLLLLRLDESDTQGIIEFRDYFTRLYVDGPLKYWNESCTTGPTTNNGLEAQFR